MTTKQIPIAVTIEFEDEGQDFTQWDLASDGSVIGCRPFQGSYWGRGRVASNLSQVDVGSQILFESPTSGLITIKYPIVAVTYHPATLVEEVTGEPNE